MSYRVVAGAGGFYQREATQAVKKTKKGFNVGKRRLLLSATSLVLVNPAEAIGVKCTGMNGRDLQLCLRAEREKQGLPPATQDDEERGPAEPVGEKITLPSGIQYREIESGDEFAPVVAIGDTLEIQFTVYRLSSGAYFKYSSGGIPVLLFSLGTGKDFGDDVSRVYRFVLGQKRSLPLAATYALVGLHRGGTRRVLIPPGVLGWDDKGTVLPQPQDFGGKRRLASHFDEPLLFEATVVNVQKTANQKEALPEINYSGFQGLPAPPRL